MKFNNGASKVYFIPPGVPVDTVIRFDRDELEVIGGSFEAIADRMEDLIRKITEDYQVIWDIQRKQAFLDQGYETDEFSDVPGCVMDESTPAGKIMKAVKALRPALIPGETEILFVQKRGGHGWQECPFHPCPGTGSYDHVIRNSRTEQELWISDLTVHLAREHHLLEKKNPYGISAYEFYEHFMPDGARI
jgi:hypothetical protein